MLAARVTSKPQALRQLKQSLLHISSQEVSVYCYDYWGTNRQIKGCLLPGWSMSSCSVLPCCHLSRPTSMIFSPDSLKKCTAKHCNYPAYSQSNFTATAGLSSFISYGTWAANFKFILWDSHYTTPIFFFLIQNLKDTVCLYSVPNVTINTMLVRDEKSEGFYRYFA